MNVFNKVVRAAIENKFQKVLGSSQMLVTEDMGSATDNATEFLYGS